MKSLVGELAQSNGTSILFVDELSNFVGSKQVNDLLASSIINDRLNIIGGSSKQDYLENVNTVAEVSALFEPIMIGGDYSGLSNDAKRSKATRYRGDNVSG